jgi:uncharacterized DUF497 family protein
MSKIERIRKCITEQNYRISVHAQEEADEDNLTKKDVENIILTGRIVKKFTHDPRGTRYQIIGKSRDGRTACVICRFVEANKLGIITVFLKEG